MKTDNFKKRKGVSIVLIFIIASIVLTIALGINGISTQQMKTMSEMGFSIVSFYAADSGAERKIYDLYKSDDAKSLTGVALPNSASFSVKVTCNTSPCPNLYAIYDSSCSSTNYFIESVGTYKGINRALELKY
ncbi:MAG: hypothetical protein E4H47_00480 [Parcubacteria group bacterium]|nr:MAG: hypothetical protein E4H47_00480 [Parcubacteria group bacterium]